MSNLQADVIIVSAGAAGLSAAVAAAEKGAKVIAFEKGSTTGGTGNMGMGPFGVESRIQKFNLKGPTRDEAFKMFMDYTHWRVDAQLVRAYIDKAATTIGWLEDMGVTFVDAAAYFRGGQPTWHIVKPETGQPGPMAAATMYKIMTARAKELGAEILLQTPVKKIVKKGDKITGVVAENQAGETIQAEAKAVVVATGGFGNNPSMIKKHTIYEYGKDIFNFRVPGIDGDGLRMAWAVGAASTEMNMEMVWGPSAGDELGPDLGCTFRQPHLMVNLSGERFLNEEVMDNTTFCGNAISVQKERTAFVIYDGSLKKHMETVGFDSTSLVHRVTKVSSDIDDLVKGAVDAGFKDIFVAETLDEMAEKTGIDAKGLKATVDEYNGFCEEGFDYKFNKSHHLLRPIKEPKYYACKVFPGAYGSLGGIKINHRTEVLDKKWDVISGLYAAGTDACSIYGDSYPFILPGNTMGFAINSGRIAGENAAAYSKQEE